MRRPVRWFLQRVELLRERNRLEAIVRAQTYEIHRLRTANAFWRDAHDRALRMGATQPTPDQVREAIHESRSA